MPESPGDLKDLMGTQSKRGRPGVTLEDVREACERLTAQGRRIGPTNVRLELGGRGSFRTIVAHLRALGHTTPRSKRTCCTAAMGPPLFLPAFKGVTRSAVVQRISKSVP
jgi:hypothetical protein